MVVYYFGGDFEFVYVGSLFGCFVDVEREGKVMIDVCFVLG